MSKIQSGNPKETIPEAPILTLKNLYRLLTQRDMLLPSYPVWSEKETRGLSLNRFWQAYFQKVFPRQTDLSVFDNPQMGRTLNRLMNRNGGAGLMASWFADLTPLLSPRLLGQMTAEWMTLFSRYHSNMSSLTSRLRIFTDTISEQDDLNAPETEQFLKDLILTEDEAGPTQVPFLFHYAWALAWLTLCALFGVRSGQPAFTVLRLLPEASCQAIYRQKAARPSAESVRILTRDCSVSSEALPENEYVGRSRMLSSIMESLREGNGKLAVSGPGGSGKTEFVRQLVRRLTSAEYYHRIAFVQYEYDLKSDIPAAFPSLGDSARLSAVQRLLEDPAEGKALLVIDQVKCREDNREILRDLSRFSCDIILTTRDPAPEGFQEVDLPVLSPEEAAVLFSRFHSGTENSTDEIKKLCRIVDNHPLAIILLAKTCRARFWSVSRMTAHLQGRKAGPGRPVQGRSAAWLTRVFSRVYDLSELSPEKKQLMRLLSGMPYGYFLPDRMLPYMADITGDRDHLADLCLILHNLGLLLWNKTGYALHPLIAETVQSPPLRAEEFPKLWSMLPEEIERKNPTACGILLSMFARMTEPDLSLIRCLSRLERNIGVLPYLRLPGEFYEKHRLFLETHPHDTEDDINYQLALGLRDIVILSTISNLGTYLRNILSLMPEDSFPGDKTNLYSLLEYASLGSDTTLAEEIFHRIRPSRKNPLETAQYLVSWSMLQRRKNGDPEAALLSLQQAESLLSANIPNFTSIDYPLTADMYYRQAVCLLDLSRPAEAKVRLEFCLDAMEKRGFPADSSKVMSSQSTYAVALFQSGEYEQALRVYERLDGYYRRQKREHSVEYASMRNNTAYVLNLMGRLEEAERIILEVLRLDEELPPSMDTRATHFKNAAWFLGDNKKWASAKPLAEKAVELRRQRYGEDSPWVSDAETVHAYILNGLGEKEEARRIIGKALNHLLEIWGPDHKSTKKALEIKALTEAAD